VAAIMEESRSYYLLGFAPSPNGKSGLHPIKVRVNRPDVEVRARTGYYTPTEKQRRAEQLRGSGVDRSIESPVPNGGVPLAVTAAPFLDATGKPVTTIVLTVSQPKEADYTVRIPTDRLPAGEYLMKIDASNGARALERTMRFRMR
jgi:hypothetical protein